MEERTDLTSEQKNLLIKMEEFEKKINEFKLPLNHFVQFVDKNPDIYYLDMIPVHYKEFSDNMANYKLSENAFLKSWNRKTIDNMIHFLWEAWNNLNDILKIVMDRNKLTKLRVWDEFRKKKPDIILNNMMKIIREYAEYLRILKYQLKM